MWFWCEHYYILLQHDKCRTWNMTSGNNTATSITGWCYPVPVEVLQVIKLWLCLSTSIYWWNMDVLRHSHSLITCSTSTGTGQHHPVTSPGTSCPPSWPFHIVNEYSLWCSCVCLLYSVCRWHIVKMSTMIYACMCHHKLFMCSNIPLTSKYTIICPTTTRHNWWLRENRWLWFKVCPCALSVEAIIFSSWMNLHRNM